MIYTQFQLSPSKDLLTSNSARMVATGNFECNRCKAWKNSGTYTSAHDFLYLLFSHLLSGRLVIRTGRSQCRNISSCRIPLFISQFTSWLDVPLVPRLPLHLRRLPIAPILLLPFLFLSHRPRSLKVIDGRTNRFLHG